MENMNSQFTREKEESDLYSTYEKAIAILEKGDILQGDSLLSSLMNSPLLPTLQDPDFKYSIFLSLAHAKEAQNLIDDSLSFYYRANKLKQNSDPNLWLKLALLCEKQGYFSQADQCYQECLRFSKGVAFEQVLYEKMIRMGFLAQEWENTLKRLEFLKKKGFLSEEMLGIKCYIYLKSNNYESYEQSFREGIQRNPQFNLENNQTIQNLKKNELLKKEAIASKHKIEEKDLHEPEFNISLDKNSWKSCLETLIFIVKVLSVRIRGVALKAKYRKSSKFKMYLEGIQKLSIAETPICFKEKKDNLIKLPSKYKKSNLKSSSNENAMEIEMPIVVNSQEKVTTVIEEKTAAELEKEKDHNLRGKSKRIQNIKTSEITIEEHAQSFFNKRHNIFLSKLNEYKENSSNSNNNDNNNNAILSIFQSFFTKKEQNNIDDIMEDTKNKEIYKNTDEKSLKRACSYDFVSFLPKTKTFNSLVSLLEEILVHFLENKTRTFQNPSEFIKKLKEICPDSLLLCPNPILLEGEIRKFLMKLFFSMFNFTKPLMKNLETNLTLFEMAFEYFLEKKAQWCQIPSEKNNKKLVLMKSVLQELSLEFLKNNFSPQITSEKEKLLLRIRAFHILTLFYSYKDFQALHLAKSSFCLLKKSLHSLLNDDFIFAKKEENPIFMNLFWLNCRVLDASFFELVEERINDINENLSQLQGDALLIKLRKYLDLFSEKAMKSFDDALDLYYKQILDFTLSKNLDKKNFAFSAKEILKIMNQILMRNKSSVEELRKDFNKLIESLKIEKILQVLIEKIDESSSFDDISELFCWILKILVLMFSIFSHESFKDFSSFIYTSTKALANLLEIGLKIYMEKEENFLLTAYYLFHYLLDNILDFSLSQHQKLFPLNFRKLLIQLLFFCNDQKNEDHFIFDEISHFFYCFYGINNPKKNENMAIVVENEKFQESSLITDLSEIGFFIKYISLFHDEYFELDHQRFKPSIQAFLVSSFDFLKKNNEAWLLCPQLRKFVSEDLNLFLDSGDLVHLKDLLAIKKQGDTGFCESNCLCSASCFPSSSEMRFFYEKGFFLLGKAFLDQDSEVLRIKKSCLKKCEKMFQINVCLNPYDFKAWLFLARLYREMGFLFIDHAIYNIMQNSIKEIEGSNHKMERIFTKIFMTLEENIGDAKLIRLEAKNSLVIFYVLELAHAKLKWIKGEILWENYYKLQNENFYKIESIGVQNDESIRILYLKEIFVKRKKLLDFSKENNILHLKNMIEIKLKMEKFLISEDSECKDESTLIEIEVETLISLWKILKRYIRILIFVKNLHFEKDFGRFSQVFSELNIMDISELQNIINNECLGFLKGIEEIDPENCSEINNFSEIFKEIPVDNDDEEEEKTDFFMEISQENNDFINFNGKIDIEKVLLLLAGVLTSKPKAVISEKQKSSGMRKINLIIFRFLDVIAMRMSKILNKYSKKYRYYKSYVRLCYYSAKIFLFLQKNDNYAKVIKNIPTFNISNSYLFFSEDLSIMDKFMRPFDELFSIKTFELVEIYKKEKDPLFCSLFHRDMMFLFLKIKLIKMKAVISKKRVQDLDKLRLLNKKISKIMFCHYDETEVINELLFNAYWITLKELLEGIISHVSNVNMLPVELNLQKWIDDLVFMIVKQRSIQKILKEKKPEIYEKLEEILKIGYKIDNPTEEIDGNSEEFKNKALNYFVSLHYKRKKGKKNMQEEMTSEITLVDN